jgi:hypothetical protein
MNNKIFVLIFLFAISFNENQASLTTTIPLTLSLISTDTTQSTTSETTLLLTTTAKIPSTTTSYADPCNPTILNYSYLEINNTSVCYAYYARYAYNFNYVSFGEGKILPKFCSYGCITYSWDFVLWSPDGKYCETNHSKFKKLIFKRITFCNKSIYKNN